MRPPDRPRLQQAVDDIDYFLTVLEDQEIDKRVWSKLYDLIEDGWTPPKVNARLTKTQYMALVYRTKLRRRKRPDEPLDERQGKPLTDEEREAILADWDQGEPLSDAGREALTFWARGGWLESSRQMAVRLRNAGETVAADEINEALRPLCDEPRDAAERSGYREAMRTAAEYVKTILVQYPIQRQPSELMAETFNPLASEVSPNQKRKGGKKSGVNGRMLDAMQKDPKVLGLNSREWARLLTCSASSVVGTKTWNDLKMGRERIKAERARDRRSKTKTGSGSAVRRRDSHG